MKMSKEQEFAIFVIEIYKQARNLTGKDVFSLFEKHQIFAAIQENYFLWHIESPDNFVAEIDALLDQPLA